MTSESAKNHESGLSAKDAAKELRIHGLNEISVHKKSGLVSFITGLVKEPMLFILVSCVAIYFLLGETTDALMLSSFVIVVLGMTFYEQYKTERALEALRDLSSPRALVIRDGKEVRIPGIKVVLGDLIMLQEGDRVPADAKILSSTNLTIDESLLTGESMPVDKTPWKELKETLSSNKDKQSFVFMGSLVVQGHGIAQVTAIGGLTEMGKIGKSLQTIENEDTLLQKETRKMVNKLFVIGLVFCIIVFVIYGLTRSNWFEGLQVGLILGMSLLPQEFSVVLIIFLTLGAWRISKRQVLTRNMPVVETLGATTVLCVDKTGTLTQNRMALRSLVVGEETLIVDEVKKNSIPQKFQDLLMNSYLACRTETFDPMEKGIKKTVEQMFSLSYLKVFMGEHLKEYPLTKKLLVLTQIWKLPKRNFPLVVTKGAPEAIAKLCKLPKDKQQELMEQVRLMAKDGLRVLGVAKASLTSHLTPKNHVNFNYEFVGLIGFSDPIRPTVKEAINECYEAGIRVTMITGDYPGTAQYVAKQVGILNFEKYLTGEELKTLDNRQLAEKVKTINVFARIAPEQKLQIVNAFKANKEVVAMTGDGVNDAPALKAANVGLAMGERGTDVAREAADLVLLKDDFGSIVKAIRTGRRIFDNLKKAMSYILAVHLPIAGLSFVPVLFQLPLILLPAHIAFLELVINPACSAVFEGEKGEANLMTRPPRKLTESLFTKNTFIISILQGLSVLAMLLLVYLLAIFRGMGEDEIRTLTFTSLVIANLALIITNRSWTQNIVQIIKIPNKAMMWVFGGTFFFLGLILTVPVLRQLFHFSQLHLDDVVICLITGSVGILWFELLKIYKATNRFKII